MKDITEYIDLILQAKEEALKRNIKANSIAINKNLVEVKETILPNAILYPMICGLEIVTVNDLPDNYAFAVYESKKTREDVLTEEVRKETAKEILLLLGVGFDETTRKDFKDLPWYKQFCKELKLRYGVNLEDEQ